MISDSHTRYGSALAPGGARHGSVRRWRSYQASSAAGSGGGSASSPPLASRKSPRPSSRRGTGRPSAARSALDPKLREAAFFRRRGSPATLIAVGLAERHKVNKPVRRYPRPLAELIKPCLGEAFARQGFASSDIVTHWAEIVGPEIAAHAEPVKLQWPRQIADEPQPGTLVLRVEGPAAIEIQHLSGVILERVNRFFGWRAVGRIALRQAPLARRALKRARPGPSPEAVARVEASLTDVADEG